MGWWDAKRNVRVLGYTLHVDQCTIKWALALKALQLPGDFLPLAGMPFDHARNSAAQHCLQHGYTHLFSLDSDVIPPPDAILKLLATGKPFVSGLYCRRSPPWSVPVAQKNGQWLSGFKPGSLVEVDVVGAGCLLISADLLRRIPPQRPQAGKHWFDWRVDCQGVPGIDPGSCLSEDFSLCRHIKKTLGESTWLHSGVICEHVGFASATHGNYRPMDHGMYKAA